MTDNRKASRLRRAKRLATMLGASFVPQTETVYLYNLDNNRPDVPVHGEIKAFLKDKPAVLMLVEAIGNSLPFVPGYTTFKDRTSQSRANLAVYVRRDLYTEDFKWHEVPGSWPRPNGPGMHPPREFLQFVVGRMPMMIAHQAPRNAKNWQLLQSNGHKTVISVFGKNDKLARLKPWLLGWDANLTMSDREGPSLEKLARRVRARVYNGNRIDQFFGRNLRRVKVETITSVNGVHLESDHGRATKITFTVQKFWLTRRGDDK